MTTEQSSYTNNPVRVSEITDCQIAVAEIDVAAAAIAECYNQLPPSQKAVARKLAHALSSLRGRLIAQQCNASAAPGC